MPEEKKIPETQAETKANIDNSDRPRRGLEDWEMLQQKEEPPLRVPYWFLALIAVLFIGAVLLSFPLLGVRSGFERPWMDGGILVGVGYGIISLIIIYFFLRKSKSSEKN